MQFSKVISGEVISKKLSLNSLGVFHDETMEKRHFHLVSTWFQYETHAVYF